MKMRMTTFTTIGRGCVTPGCLRNNYRLVSERLERNTHSYNTFWGFQLFEKENCKKELCRQVG